MEYSFEYMAEDDYIMATLVGDFDLRMMKDIITEAAPIKTKHQCNKMIGDFRQATFSFAITDIVEAYRFWMETLRSNKLSPYESRRVILLTSRQQTSEKLRFLETFAINRNSQIRIFYDKEKAVHWIKRGESMKPSLPD